MTVIMLTFIMPSIVLTVTSSSSLDSRSKAGIIDVNDNSTQTTTPIKNKDGFVGLMATIYPFIIAFVLLCWVIVILIYFGYKQKEEKIRD